jgi:hypothetical protein
MRLEQLLQDFNIKLHDLQIHKSAAPLAKKFCKGENKSGEIPISMVYFLKAEILTTDNRHFRSSPITTPSIYTEHRGFPS